MTRHDRSGIVRTAALAVAGTLAAGGAARAGDGDGCGGGGLDNWVGTSTVACPCFVTGEEVGAVFVAPPEDYPIVVDSMSIVWGSLFGAPPSTEEAVHLYDGELPNPGAPIASIADPVLLDGEFNVFTFDGPESERTIDSGPFTLTLEFRHASDILAGAPVHDGAGCLPGRNVVYAIPGGWTDACTLGVSGNWFIRATYHSVCNPCPSDLDGDSVVSTSDLLIVLGNWGGPAGDVTGDGTTDTADLLNVLADWGPC
jgi:hypothetical protein